MYIFCTYHYLFGFADGCQALQERKAETVCMFVGQEEQAVVRAAADGLRQAVLQLFANDYFLFVHTSYLLGWGKNRNNS